MRSHFRMCRGLCLWLFHPFLPPRGALRGALGLRVRSAPFHLGLSLFFLFPALRAPSTAEGVRVLSARARPIGHHLEAAASVVLHGPAAVHGERAVVFGERLDSASLILSGAILLVLALALGLHVTPPLAKHVLSQHRRAARGRRAARTRRNLVPARDRLLPRGVWRADGGECCPRKLERRAERRLFTLLAALAGVPPKDRPAVGLVAGVSIDV